MLLRIALAAALALTAGAPGFALAPQVESAPKPTYRISGRLVLYERGQPSTDLTLDPRKGAVWFEPEAGLQAPRAVTASMSTLRKQFSPQTIVVPVGSTVRFPNMDPILHNVFSVSGKNSFDLGLVGSGQGKSAVFREAGLVRVFCNVHHAMFSNVLAVRTPYFVVPDQRGRFSLAGLPGGRGTLFFWHERTEPLSRKISIPESAELTLELPVTLPRIPPHKNKLGKSYARGAYD